MVLDMDQAQRRDIDATLNDRLTLVIDEENVAHSPFVLEADKFVGNNWFRQGSRIVKLNVAEQDSVTFVCDAIGGLSQKDITKVLVEFDFEITNVSANYPILSNVSLTCMGMTNYMVVDNILTLQDHIAVDCALFSFSSSTVNTAISEQGFDIGLNFVGVKSNATVKLSNVVFKFEFVNKLEDEVLAVSNRVSSSFDIFVEDDDLVVDFLGDGQGEHSSGGGVDIDTVERLIGEALDRCSIDVTVQLLSNGMANVNASLNKGDV